MEEIVQFFEMYKIQAKCSCTIPYMAISEKRYDVNKKPIQPVLFIKMPITN